MNKKLLRYGLICLGFFVIVGATYWSVQQYRTLSAEYVHTLSELRIAQEENANLLSNLEYEIDARAAIEEQLGKLGGAIGTLEKLSQTDEELLKKYSKVYFLNENYVPAKLSLIPLEFIFDKETKYLVHTNVLPHLTKLLNAARDSGTDLVVASAFRSFDTQAALKSSYKVIYGSGANQFSADQGYSEHQLGTTVDFTTTKLGAVFDGFAKDKSYTWLKENAHKYGFVLSYPENNSYYKFEPWHWRYVGVDLATHLHNEGKHFYDLDQREIDTYLVKLFD